MPQEYYDEIAAGYDELHRREQLRKLKFIARSVSVDDGDMMLDVGCGTAMAADFFGCDYVGLDPSIELLRQASAPVVQGVAEELPFKDDSFDIVVCLSAFHNFDEPHKALEEMKRVGKDRFVITVFKKGKDEDKREALTDLIRSDLDVQMEVEEEHDILFFCTHP